MAALVRRSLLVVATLAFVLVPAGAARAAAPHVDLLHVTGVVDQVMAAYVDEGIRQAAAQGAAAVILEIDTPGGSLDSMHDIDQHVLDAPVPVITWVAPQGARAASAGTFITMAGALAYMAPGTNIGAASPVGSGGQDLTGTEATKVMNDAVAGITAIAQARGRNVEWAVSAVRTATSASAQDAVSQHVVDGIAGTVDEVLAAATGRQVKVGSTTVTLALDGATVDELGMNPLQALLHLLADPNLAFVLFIIGAYGLILEFIHPNLISGIAGAISLILAFIGFGSLPLNLAGLLLVVVGIVLFVLELSFTSHGLLTAGGLAAFVLGGATFYTAPTPVAPDVSVAWPLLATMAIATAVFMGVIVATAWRIRHMPALPVWLGGSAGAGTGPVPLGAAGRVERPLAPLGTVYAGGEEWSARAADGAVLERGTPVRVAGQDGLTLVVERADPDGPAQLEVPDA